MTSNSVNFFQSIIFDYKVVGMKIMKMYCRHCLSKILATSLFSVSGKQKVRFPEFLRMMAEQEGKNINTEHEILAAFTALDRKKTGSVTRKQLQHLMTETGDKLTTGECK